MRKLFWLAGAWLALVSCGLFSSAQTTPPPENGAVATSVAATMQALQHPTVAAPSATPSLVAAATATPLPSPTSTPLPQPEPQAVYIMEGNVWRWQPGSAPQQLTNTHDGVSPRLSPDGQLVALTRGADDAQQEIWVVDINGQNLRRLVGADDLAHLPRPQGIGEVEIYTLAWVPGTHEVAYNTLVRFAGPGLVTSDDLHLVNADTLVKQTLLPAGEGGQFVFSPDGQRVAVSTPTHVDLLWLDGRAPRQRVLSYEQVMTYSEYLYAVAPQWAPDGSYLLVLVPPADPLVAPSQPSTVWRLPADGSAASLLAELPADPFWFSSMQEPVFNASLTALVYLGQEGDGQTLHVTTPDGREDVIEVAAPQLIFLGWSPAGDAFAYAMGQAGKNGSPLLWQTDVPPTMLVNREMPNVQEVAWITDEHFLISQGMWGDWELFAGTRTGEVTLLVSGTRGALPRIDTSP